MTPISVDCTFSTDGSVRVRRVKLDGRPWQPVGQGRQWVGENGRHVLIMLPNNQVREILLSAERLTWVLLPPPAQIV
jgi:hypothetical protein